MIGTLTHLSRGEEKKREKNQVPLFRQVSEFKEEAH